VLMILGSLSAYMIIPKTVKS
ncbi:hypothetical protein ACO1LX_20490, partial [Staphylococcus aureus]